MGQVTIIADGHVLVAAVDPRVIVALHHMAVYARLGVVREVARTPRIAECEGTHAASHPHHNDDEDDQGKRIPAQGCGRRFARLLRAGLPGYIAATRCVIVLTHTQTVRPILLFPA